MNRRRFPLALAALVVGCKEAVSPNYEQPEVRPLSFGVYVHCGFESPRSEYGKVPGTQSPFKWPWEYMKTPDRKPQMGFYNEAEPRITEYRCGLMSEAGIGYAVYQIDTDYAAMRVAA